MSPSSETEENAYTNMTLVPLAITSGNGIMVDPQQDLMKTININPSVFYWMDPRGSSDEEESTSLDADSRHQTKEMMVSLMNMKMTMKKFNQSMNLSLKMIRHQQMNYVIV